MKNKSAPKGEVKVSLIVKFIKENGKCFDREDDKGEKIEHTVPAAVAERWKAQDFVAIIEEVQIIEKANKK